MSNARYELDDLHAVDIQCRTAFNLNCNSIKHSCRSRRLGVLGVEVKGGTSVEWAVDIEAGLRNCGSRNPEYAQSWVGQISSSKPTGIRFDNQKVSTMMSHFILYCPGWIREIK